MSLLSSGDIGQFRSEGHVPARGPVAGDPLKALQGQLTGRVGESRSHRTNRDRHLDSNACFDPECGHRADHPRALIICDDNVADAFPLKAPTMPSTYYGRIIRGRATRLARPAERIVEVPDDYKEDSFLGLQGQKTPAEQET